MFAFFGSQIDRREEERTKHKERVSMVEEAGEEDEEEKKEKNHSPNR